LEIPSVTSPDLLDEPVSRAKKEEEEEEGEEEEEEEF